LTAPLGADKAHGLGQLSMRVFFFSFAFFIGLIGSQASVMAQSSLNEFTYGIIQYTQYLQAKGNFQKAERLLNLASRFIQQNSNDSQKLISFYEEEVRSIGSDDSLGFPRYHLALIFKHLASRVSQLDFLAQLSVDDYLRLLKLRSLVPLGVLRPEEGLMIPGRGPRFFEGEIFEIFEKLSDFAYAEASSAVELLKIAKVSTVASESWSEVKVNSIRKNFGEFAGKALNRAQLQLLAEVLDELTENDRSRLISEASHKMARISEGYVTALGKDLINDEIMLEAFGEDNRFALSLALLSSEFSSADEMIQFYNQLFVSLRTMLSNVPDDLQAGELWEISAYFFIFDHLKTTQGLFLSFGPSAAELRVYTEFQYMIMDVLNNKAVTGEFGEKMLTRQMNYAFKNFDAASLMDFLRFDLFDYRPDRDPSDADIRFELDWKKADLLKERVRLFMEKAPNFAQAAEFLSHFILVEEGRKIIREAYDEVKKDGEPLSLQLIRLRKSLEDFPAMLMQLDVEALDVMIPLSLSVQTVIQDDALIEIGDYLKERHPKYYSRLQVVGVPNSDKLKVKLDLRSPLQRILGVCSNALSSFGRTQLSQPVSFFVP
jgi:hypothetical protein